jgi:hypothetical protein
MTQPAIESTTADPPTAQELVYFCRHTHQSLAEVESWPIERFRKLQEALYTLLDREWGRTEPGQAMSTGDPEDSNRSAAITPTTTREGTLLDPAYLGPEAKKYETVFHISGNVDLEKLGSPIARRATLSPRATWDQIKDIAARGGLQVHVDGDEGSDDFKVHFRRLSHYAHEPKAEAIALGRIGAKFEADLAALNRYLMDEHASDNPDGSPKVDEAARLGLPGESGPAAALRLLVLARGRGAFRDQPPTLTEQQKRRLDQWAEISTVIHSHGHAKGNATLSECVRQVVQQLQYWRVFATQQGRRTGASIPQGGELTAEQATEHFELFINLARAEADELQRVRDLVLDRSHRMSAKASTAVGLLDVLRGLIADAHVPSVDARDMADLRARVDVAEAFLSRSLAAVAAFIQRHTGRTTRELAAAKPAELLDFADTVLKQDRQQALEEITGRIEALMKERAELRARAEVAENELAQYRDLGLSQNWGRLREGLGVGQAASWPAVFEAVERLGKYKTDVDSLRKRALAAERECHEAVESAAKYKALADTAVGTVDKLRITAPELLDLHVFVHRELTPLDPDLDRLTGESDIAWGTRLLRAALSRGAFRIPAPRA